MSVATSFVGVVLALFLVAGSCGISAAELSDDPFPDQLSLLQLRAELRRPTMAETSLVAASPTVSTDVVIDSSLDSMLHAVVTAALAAAHDARVNGDDESAAALGAAEVVVKEEALGLAGSEGGETLGPLLSTPVLLEASSTAVAAGDGHTNNKSESEEPMAATGTCGPDFPSNIDDCEHIDFGSCGNACCNLLITVPHSPAEAVRLLNRSLSGGGPDGRYRFETTAEGPEGFANLTEFAPDLPEPFSSSRSGLYVGQVTHETVGKFNDTVNFNFIANKKGDTLLHAFSLSLVAGALGDNGQNFKNIMNPMRAAFGNDGFNLEARLFNSCPGPNEKLLGPRSISKEDVDFGAELGALGLNEGASSAPSAAFATQVGIGRSASTDSNAAESDAKVATMLDTTVATATMPKIAIATSEAVSAEEVADSGNRQATMPTAATMSADEVVASENREALLAEAAMSEMVSDASPTGDEVALATDAPAAEAPAAPEVLATTARETPTELVRTADTFATMAMTEAPAVFEAKDPAAGEAESQAEQTFPPAAMVSRGWMLSQAFKAESPLEEEEEVDSSDGVLSEQEDLEAAPEERVNSLLALLDIGAERKPRHRMTHVAAVHEADPEHTPAVWLPSWVAETADSMKKAAAKGVAEAADRVKAAVTKSLDDEDELNKAKKEAQQRKAKSDRRDAEWSEAKAAAQAVPKTNTSDEPEVVLSKKAKKHGDTVLAKKAKHDSILSKNTNKRGNSVLVGKGGNHADDVHEDLVRLVLNGEHAQQPQQTIEGDSVKQPPLALATVGRSGLYGFGTGDVSGEHNLGTDQGNNESALPAPTSMHGRSGLYGFGEENAAYDVVHEERQIATTENGTDANLKR